MRLSRLSHSVRLAPVVALVAGLGLASCVAPPPQPQPVEQTTPSVTYSYRSDQELVEATRRAETYCRNYNALPRTANITDKEDGAYDVVFVCDRGVRGPTAAVATRPVIPSVSYTYNSHQQLVEATRTADSYCLGHNARARMTQITPGPAGAGSKTVVFTCEPPL